MSKLRSAYQEWLTACEKRGTDLISFNCPSCNQEIKNYPAKIGEVWDTLSTCPSCENLFIKITRGKEVETFIPEIFQESIYRNK